MSFDVLVLDDDRGAAQEYARLIEADTRLRVVCLDSVDEALEAIRQNPIKVAVLDQRMGSYLGTKVYEDIHRIDQRVRAVMFTGLADAAEVGEAFQLGYAAYLYKGDVQRLGSVVLAQYFQYQTAVASAVLQDNPAILLIRKHGIPPKRQKVEYLLLKIEVSDEEYVPQDAWSTVVSLQAGETLKHVYSTAYSTSFTIEKESQQKLNLDLGFKTPQLEAFNFALKQEISDRLKQSSTVQESLNSSTERTYQLPPEPDDPDKLHVKARRIEKAPVQRPLRATILSRCDACHLTNVVSLMVSELTHGVATRQVDTLSDGTVRTIDTGIER